MPDRARCQRDAEADGDQGDEAGALADLLADVRCESGLAPGADDGLVDRGGRRAGVTDQRLVPQVGQLEIDVRGQRVGDREHRHLLAQHQQLGVLRCRRACQQRHPAHQADEDEVEHPQDAASRRTTPRRRTRRPASIARFEPHRLIRSGPGSSRARAAITIRSAQSSFGLGVLAPQHRDLLAQHQQLGVLRCRRACRQRYPAGQADEDQVKHPCRHKPAILPAVRPLPQPNSQVNNLCPVLQPHRVRPRRTSQPETRSMTKYSRRKDTDRIHASTPPPTPTAAQPSRLLHDRVRAGP